MGRVKWREAREKAGLARHTVGQVAAVPASRCANPARKRATGALTGCELVLPVGDPLRHARLVGEGRRIAQVGLLRTSREQQRKGKSGHR